MRWSRLLSLLLVTATLQGCGADDSGDSDGGQTGSLIPTCGVAKLSEQGQSVPSGNAAFVIHTKGCPRAISFTDVAVFDANGERVMVDLEPLDNGYLVRGEDDLTAGKYTVRLPREIEAQDVTIEVAKPAAPPAQIGQLVMAYSSCTSSALSLELANDLLPYLALTQFSAVIDGQRHVVLSDYGTVSAPNGVTSFRLDHCTDGCLDNGTHEVVLYATIAGLTSQPKSIETTIEVECTESEGACSLGNERGRKRNATPLLLLLGLMGIARHRRRRLA